MIKRAVKKYVINDNSNFLLLLIGGYYFGINNHYMLF